MRDQKPSKTAYKVGMNILALGSKPGMERVLPPGIIDATQQLLIASGAAKPQAVRWARSPRMLRAYEFFDGMMPGQFEAFGYRKAFCERQVRSCIANGASQVLVLGAGYDTMGWRLAPEFSQVDFFEVDHPATAALKAKGIGHMGARPNLHLIGEDLGQHKLVDVIERQKSWKPDAPTVIVAEALLQYLQVDAVEDLFKQCASIAPDSTIVFTYIPTREDGRPDAGPRTGLVLWLLKVGGEPWLWSIRPEDLGAFLEGLGWTIPKGLGEGVGKHGVEIFAVARTRNS
jgi:methyltransferase (TIGR00027 family)